MFGTNKLSKRILQGKKGQGFGQKMQVYKERSGLLFIKFDWISGCQKIKIAF